MNRLTSLPYSVGELRKSAKIYIGNNKLSCFPLSMHHSKYDVYGDNGNILSDYNPDLYKRQMKSVDDLILKKSMFFKLHGYQNMPVTIESTVDQYLLARPFNEAAQYSYSSFKNSTSEAS